MGNPGWSFADLLPVFRAIESDADVRGDWHGKDGPVPVRWPSGRRAADLPGVGGNLIDHPLVAVACPPRPAFPGPGST